MGRAQGAAQAARGASQMRHQVRAKLCAQQSAASVQERFELRESIRDANAQMCAGLELNGSAELAQTLRLKLAAAERYWKAFPEMDPEVAYEFAGQDVVIEQARQAQWAVVAASSSWRS